MLKQIKSRKFKFNRQFVFKILELLVTGLLLAVIASLLSTHILNCQQKKAKIQQQLNSLSRIYIGCSKQWADEQFGCPQFIYQSKDYLLCAYISDFFVVQFAFDSSDSAEAYLITALTNEPKIKIQDKTMNINITLGDLSYYDFIGIPENTYGYVSNGNARAFYGESYYFTSRGNYYNYYIASYDFGFFKNNINGFLGCVSKLGRVNNNKFHLAKLLLYCV